MLSSQITLDSQILLGIFGIEAQQDLGRGPATADMFRAPATMCQRHSRLSRDKCRPESRHVANGGPKRGFGASRPRHVGMQTRNVKRGRVRGCVAVLRWRARAAAKRILTRRGHARGRRGAPGGAGAARRRRGGWLGFSLH